jgi:hypothetical protein
MVDIMPQCVDRLPDREIEQDGIVVVGPEVGAQVLQVFQAVNDSRRRFAVIFAAWGVVYHYNVWIEKEGQTPQLKFQPEPSAKCGTV